MTAFLSFPLESMYLPCKAERMAKNFSVTQGTILTGRDEMCEGYVRWVEVMLNFR
jgi:hypothetical protein